MSDIPTLLKRDANGLIAGYPYKFTPDGRVDYRAMVDRKHIFVIRDREDAVVKAQGKPISECDLSLVKEQWLRIRQGGFTQLLNLRGYTSLRYHSLSSAEGKSATICEIEFIGNYETDNKPLICSAIASASVASMDKNFLPYLESFAENRSFARCVKRALQIGILSEDEIDAEAFRGVKGEDDKVSDSLTPSVSAAPFNTLQQICAARKVPVLFETLKTRAIEHNKALTSERENERIKSDPSTWTDWSSIQPADAWLLIGKFNEADKKKTAAS